MNGLQCFAANAPETALAAEIHQRLQQRVGAIALRHCRTQTALVRRVQFAWISPPRKRADAGAVMLSFGLPSRLDSPRILHAAEVAPGRWMHHMLIRSAAEADEELLGWLAAAWALVGPGRR